MNPVPDPQRDFILKVSPAVMPRFALSKQEKLRNSRQFRQVYERGRRVSGPRLTMFYMHNKLSFSRLGLVASKKRLKLSIWRHYFQRRLREAFRLSKMRFLPGYDIVISVQRLKQEKIRFEVIKEEFLTLAKQAGLLKLGH